MDSTIVFSRTSHPKDFETLCTASSQIDTTRLPRGIRIVLQIPGAIHLKGKEIIWIKAGTNKGVTLSRLQQLTETNRQDFRTFIREVERATSSIIRQGSSQATAREAKAESPAVQESSFRSLRALGSPPRESVLAAPQTYRERAVAAAPPSSRFLSYRASHETPQAAQQRAHDAVDALAHQLQARAQKERACEKLRHIADKSALKGRAKAFHRLKRHADTSHCEERIKSLTQRMRNQQLKHTFQLVRRSRQGRAFSHLQRETLQGRLTDLETRTQATIKRLQGEISASEKKLQEGVRTSHALTQEKDSLTRDVSALRQETTELKSQLAAREARIQDLEANLQTNTTAHADEVRDLNARITRQTEEIAALQKECNELQVQLATWEESYSGQATAAAAALAARAASLMPTSLWRSTEAPAASPASAKDTPGETKEGE